MYSFVFLYNILQVSGNIQINVNNACVKTTLITQVKLISNTGVIVMKTKHVKLVEFYYRGRACDFTLGLSLLLNFI